MKTIWIAAVMIAVLAAGCGGNGDEARNMPGRAVFENQSCALCHGSNLEGTEKAPALEDLGDEWQKAELIEYMKNPMEYAKEDMRLYKQMNEYPTMMPNYGHVGEEDLGKLADYLLTK